jgi:hypothetical protein
MKSVVTPLNCPKCEVGIHSKPIYIKIMKKLIILLTACAIGLGSAFAAEKKEKGKKERPALTEEQKTLLKEIKEKYDANKDKKLDKEERAKISAEDKKRMKDAGLGGKKKKPGKKGGKKKEEAEK